MIMASSPITSWEIDTSLCDKDLYSQSYGFSSSHAQMWKLDHKEDWVPKKWCFWIVVLEKTLESPLGSTEIKSVNPKGSQASVFIGRTDAEAEASILWPPDAKSQLIGKDPDAGKDWGQEEKGTTEGEMVGWHHLINGCEFEQIPGGSEGQGSRACCSPMVSKSQTWLSNWTTTILLATPPLNIVINLLSKSCYIETLRFWGQEPSVSPFGWQSNSYSFYFT